MSLILNIFVSETSNASEYEPVQYTYVHAILCHNHQYFTFSDICSYVLMFSTTVSMTPKLFELKLQILHTCTPLDYGCGDKELRQ